MNIKFLKAYFIKDFKIALSYKFKFIFSIFSIFLTVFGFYIFSNFIGANENMFLDEYGGDYFKFILIGALSAQITILFITTLSREIRIMQLSGIFEEYIIAGRNEIVILLASFIYPLFFLIFRIFIFFIFAIKFFNADVQFSHLGIQTFIALILFSISLIGIGLISAAITISFKSGEIVNTIYLSLTAVLSGVAYPISVLPSFLSFFSITLPNTHFLQIIRDDLNNNDYYSWLEILNICAPLFIFAFFLICIGLYVCRSALKYSRINGSLLEY